MSKPHDQPVSTVGELIAALKHFPLNTPVAGTWESVVSPLYVYAAKDGGVLLDADGCSYKEQFKSGVFSSEPTGGWL